MDADALRQLHQRLFYEVLNKGQLELLPELITDDHLVEFRGGPRLRPDGKAMAALVTLVRQGLPDGVFTIEDQIVEADKLVTRFMWSGVQDGPLGQIPPTGKKLYGSGAMFGKEAGGRLTHSLIIMDLLTPLGDIGALTLGPAVAPPRP